MICFRFFTVLRKFKQFSCLFQWSHIEALQKWKNYIVRSKLYPLERNISGRGCGSDRCQVGKDIKVTGTFDSFTIKKSYKINHKLTKVLDLPLEAA